MEAMESFEHGYSRQFFRVIVAGEESYHVLSLFLYFDHLQFHCDRCLKSPHGPSCEYPVFCFQHVSSNSWNHFPADVWGAVMLAPPRPSSNRLAVEFVGDSITAGWKVPHDFGCRCQTTRLKLLKFVQGLPAYNEMTITVYSSAYITYVIRNYVDCTAICGHWYCWGPIFA